MYLIKLAQSHMGDPADAHCPRLCAGIAAGRRSEHGANGGNGGVAGGGGFGGDGGGDGDGESEGAGGAAGVGIAHAPKPYGAHVDSQSCHTCMNIAGWLYW
jgi:hypothetical protein